MKYPLLALSSSLLASISAVFGANSIIADPVTLGLFEFAPTLVHSDAGNPSGGQLVAPEGTAYGVDHSGVVQLQTGAGDGLCSAALLSSGQHVVTAAHCAQTGLSAVFQVGADRVTIPITAVDVHPNYSGSVFNGYDVAVMTLDEIAPPEVARYEVNRSLNDLGVTGVAVGYGASGYGGDGVTVAGGEKRAGLIEFEINALPSPIIQNPQTQLTADFDSGDPSNDAMALYYGIAPDLGFGADEIGFASGDSGGPVFQASGDGWVIAGVASYVARFTPPTADIAHSDIDGTKNSSFGEFSVAARLAEPSVLGFIDDIAGVSVTPIPEPSSILLVLSGMSAFFRRRRPV